MDHQESFQRLEMATQLAKCPDELVIGVEELSTLLNTTPDFVYQLSRRNDDRLPPKLTSFGRKLCWTLGSYRQWIRMRSETRVIAAAASKPMGRPRRT